MPSATIIPVLAYADVRGAVEWLCRCFGFAERLRIGDHRSQLMFGDGCVVVTRGTAEDGSTATAATHSVMLRVADVDAHYLRAADAGVLVASLPASHPYGERQYTAIDIGGHAWTFSQSISDVDPASWGGELFDDA